MFITHRIHTFEERIGQQNCNCVNSVQTVMIT